jgi:hypothetical protein
MPAYKCLLARAPALMPEASIDPGQLQATLQDALLEAHQLPYHPPPPVELPSVPSLPANVPEPASAEIDTPGAEVPAVVAAYLESKDISTGPNRRSGLVKYLRWRLEVVPNPPSMEQIRADYDRFYMRGPTELHRTFGRDTSKWGRAERVFHVAKAKETKAMFKAAKRKQKRTAPSQLKLAAAPLVPPMEAADTPPAAFLTTTLKKAARIAELARLAAIGRTAAKDMRTRKKERKAARLLAKQALSRARETRLQAAADRNAACMVADNAEILQTETPHGARNHLLMAVLEPFTIDLQDMIDEAYGAELPQLRRFPVYDKGKWTWPAGTRDVDRFCFNTCLNFLHRVRYVSPGLAGPSVAQSKVVTVCWRPPSCCGSSCCGTW